MAKAKEAAAPAAAETPVVENATDEITYIPGEGDPAKTTWNGVTFHANKPVKVSRRHTVLVPMRQEFSAPDGSIISRAIEKRIPMVELAKGNPFFSVNGKEPAKRIEGKARVPDTPETYRGYAMAWIAEATSDRSIDARWAAEAGLREKCGVNDADIAWLMP